MLSVSMSACVLRQEFLLPIIHKKGKGFSPAVYIQHRKCINWESGEYIENISFFSYDEVAQR